MIDRLHKGALIRPNHCLCNRVNIVRYNVIEQTLIYKMRTETLALLAMDIPELKASVKPQLDMQRRNKIL